MSVALPGRLYPPLVGLVFATLAGDLLLTSGFMLLRAPPVGPGVPVNELTLLVALAVLLLGGRGLGGVATCAGFWPLLGLWILAGAHLILDVPEHGAWAIRDAANIIESGYFVVGFALARDPRFPAAIARFLGIICPLAAFYTLLFPFREALAPLSPRVPSMSGYEAPILFSFVNTSSVALTAVCHTLLRRDWPMAARVGLAGLVVMWLIVFVQARITYPQLMFVILLLALFARRQLGECVMAAGIAAVFMVLFLASGIHLPGRLGVTFTLDFLWGHVRAIWGGGGAEMRDVAGGVGLRLGWWAEIQSDLARSPRHWFLGLGYGAPLTSFRGLHDDIVREPHNSYVSIYGRLGFVGISLFAAFLATIAFGAARLIRRTRGDGTLHVPALTMACFLGVHAIYALGEGGMEVSFIAVPFYFIAGAVAGLLATKEGRG